MPSAVRPNPLRVPRWWVRLAPTRTSRFWHMVERERLRLRISKNDRRMESVIINLKGGYAMTNKQLDKMIDDLASKAGGVVIEVEAEKEAAKPAAPAHRPVVREFRLDESRRTPLYNPSMERKREMAGGRDPLTIADLPAFLDMPIKMPEKGGWLGFAEMCNQMGLKSLIYDYDELALIEALRKHHQKLNGELESAS